MDHGQGEPRGGGRGEQAARRPLDVGERQRERRRNQQLPRRRRRQPERGVGTTVRGSKRRHGHLGADDRDRRPDAAEEGIAGLVGDEKGERRQHRGLVQDDVRRVEKGNAGNESEKGVPEREGVAGMQAAVRELVHSVKRERVERLELAHPSEVEEAVAADLAGDVPEQDPEHRARAEHPPAAGEPPGAGSAPAEAEGHEAGSEQQHERQAQRPTRDERHRERSEEERQRPGERDRGAAQPERTGDDGSREQQDPGRERKPQQRHRSSSSGSRPDASQAAASRYIRPRSSRKAKPRSRNAQHSSRRARSA